LMPMIGINGIVLGFTFLLSAVTGIIFGVAPALQVARTDLQESIKEGGRGATSRHGRMLRGVLVVAELALSLVLLVGAGLLIESFVRLLLVNPGFNANNVLTMQVYLPPAQYNTPAAIKSFYDQALERVSAVSGIKAAGAINFLPLTAWRDYTDFDIEGRPAPPPGEEFTSQYRVVDTNYFRTMEIPLLRGHGFTSADSAEAPGVAIVNAALVRRYWSNSDPIGQRIHLHSEANAAPYRPVIRDSWLRIVGVAGDIHDWQWGDNLVDVVYLPAEQNPSRIMRVVARANGDPLRLAPNVRQAILKVDPNQPVTDVKTMDELVSEAMAQRRATMLLLATFAGLALVLAAVGVYGVFAYSVTQRRHEIGIRMAIGAQTRDVMKLIMGQSLVLAGLGIVIGGLASLSLGRWLASQLYGVKVTDPATYFGVSAVLLVVALAACWIPARRAARMDPVTALRYE
jgi:predicted permease